MDDQPGMGVGVSGTPAETWLQPDDPALTDFRAQPSGASLGGLARAVWAVVERDGGTSSLVVKETLYQAGQAAGLDDQACRSAIDCAVPGPVSYAGGGLAAEQPRADGAPLRTAPLPTASSWNLPGWEISESLGLVVGNTVRTRNSAVRLGTGLQATFGGELNAYTNLLTEARNEAIGRMNDAAAALGAEAVVAVSLATSTVFEIAVEVVAMGTAVRATRLTGTGAQGA